MEFLKIFLFQALLVVIEEIINKIKEYEHRFYKSGDTGKSVSAKESIVKENFEDFVQSNTKYYNHESLSPQIHKIREFSPVFRRQTSNAVNCVIDLHKVLEKYTKSKENKKYITLTGKKYWIYRIKF